MQGLHVRGAGPADDLSGLCLEEGMDVRSGPYIQCSCVAGYLIECNVFEVSEGETRALWHNLLETC